MKKSTMKAYIFFSALVAASLLSFAPHDIAQAREQSRLNTSAVAVVRVQTVESSMTPSLNEVPGTVQAVESAMIAAKITGVIKEMPVILGSKVQQGDLLVKISAEEISARLLQAQAQFEQARRNLGREKNLLKKNAATAETVKSMEDAFRVAEAIFQEATTMLDYTKITAPFNGLITRKYLNVGDLATPGIPLLLLENNQKLQVVAAVPETLVQKVTPGDRLVIGIPAAELEITGTVAEIAPAADPVTRTAPVKIDIVATSGLRLGQFARISFPGDSTESLFIPVSAVLRFGQMEKVFVVKEGKVKMRLVRTGVQTQSQIEILAGLEAGELVVTDANNQLVDGQAVTIKQ